MKIEQKFSEILADLAPIKEMYPRVIASLEEIKEEFFLLHQRHELLRELLVIPQFEEQEEQQMEIVG